jgi:MATE family multidrug resistance protein
MSHPLDSRSIDAQLDLGATARGGLREVIVLALPVVATQVSVTLMGVVDSIMVGRLGATELGAVGLGGVWTWTLVCFWMGLATVVQTFVSQAHGAGANRECGAWAWQGLGVLVPMGLAAGIALHFGAGEVVHLLDPGPTLEPIAASYMSMRAFGVAGNVAMMVLASFFRGLGDTRTPLWVTIFANLTNVVLDYGLIFGELGMPEMGVAGAGLATAMSEWLGALALFAAFRSRRMRDLHGTKFVPVDWTRVRRLFSTGLAIGGQWLLEMLSFAIFLLFVARMGDESMAASQAFISLLSLSFMQASGIGLAVSTLVGRYIGARDPGAVRKSYASAMWLATILGGVIALVFLAVPGLLMSAFTSNSEVLRLGGPLLAIGAVFQLFDAWAIVTDGALRGAGDTRLPFLMRFALGWLLFVPLAWILGVYLEGGLFWAWIGGSVYVVALAGMLRWRFASGAWQSIRI